MTQMIDADILISGGGVAGLTAACALGSAGFAVICVDPNPPVTERDATGADLRTTAFLQPARDVLNQAGLWDRLAPHAAPLQVMRIVDAGGVDPVARLTHDFNASDISDAPFGWNLPNWLLRREMVARIAELPNVTFLAGIGATDLLTRDTGVQVRLSDGRVIRAKLVIAADGRNSPMRRAAGIGAKIYRYGQKALAFAVTHDAPHENISTEIHRTGGPFTLVPLPDYEGRPSSAVVWMERSPEATRLFHLDVPRFEQEMTERSAGLYGPLRLASKRTIWPIISQIAHSLTAQRLALMAEAAHVVPPIGAQGLNMSLTDLRVLRDLVADHPDDIGQEAVLRAYARARHGDIALRVSGIDALNRASMVAAQPLRDMRMRALDTLYSVSPIRRLLMQTGLGAKGI